MSSGSSYVEKDDIIRALKEALEEKGDDNMSTLAEQWIEEGLQKGLKKGKILGLKEGVKKGLEKGVKAGKLQNAREMVLEAVASRFGKAPDDIVDEINAVNNRALLKLLHRQAIVCTDLNVFGKPFVN